MSVFRHDQIQGIVSDMVDEKIKKNLSCTLEHGSVDAVREAFEKKFPVPDGISWWEDGNCYHSGGIITKYNNYWEGWQAGLSANKWISVKDMLPKWDRRDDTPCVLEGKTIPPALFSKTVQVALVDGGVRTDHLTAIEGSGEPWFDTYGKRVIAWQPLPNPPEK